MAESSNPFDAGVFYSGSFITSQFVQSFSELFADRRLAIIAEISAKPDVWVLAMKFQYVVFEVPDISPSYIFYYINTSGELTAVRHLPSFAGKTVKFINTHAPPAALILTDEAGGFRYLSKHSTLANNTMVSSGTEPSVQYAGNRDDLHQFFGTHIEFVGEDSESIYHLTVNSSNVISVNLIRTEPQRNAPIYVSSGHLRPYDGQNLYIGSITKLGDISRQLESTDTSYGGISIPAVGSITFQIADQYLDYAATQSWDTRNIVVRAGLADDPISVYPVIIRGQTERPEWNLDELTVTLRDQGILFDRAVQTNTYLGTGGYEGTEELKGKIKPLALGNIPQASPVLVDPTINLYQFNDGPTHPFAMFLYEGGSAHFNSVTTTDLLLWEPTPTEVSIARIQVDYTRGFFRTSAPPEATLTFSLLQGSTSVPITNTLSDILLAILQRATPEIGIDNNSFDLHKSVVPNFMGIYITENKSVKDATRQLCKHNGSSLVVDNLGSVSLRGLRATPPKAFIEENSIVENTNLSRREAKKPGAKYRQGYGRVYTTLDEGQLLGTVVGSEFIRQLFQDEYRWTEIGITDRGGPYFGGSTGVPAPTGEASSPLGLARYDSAEVIEEVTTNFGRQDDMLVDAALRDHSLRDLWDITVSGFLYQFNLLDTVLIQLNRFGMSHPQTAIIIGLTELSPTSTSEDQTRLLLLC